ncbi:MAG: YwmB family TATA-box binding protein [Syntrophomonas sp.]
MRRAAMYLFVFIILCISMEQSVNYSLGNQIKNQSPFCLSFSSIGANLLESRLDCWAKIKVNSTSKDLNSNLIHILQHLQLPVQRHKFIQNNNNELTELNYNCEKNNINYSFTLRSDQRYKETYYIVTLVTPKDTPEFQKKEQQLREIMDFNFYYLYTGTIKSLYDYNSQERLLRNIMKKLDTRTIEVYRDGKVTSMTGYSNSLRGWVQPVDGGKEKYNVQAAIRSNPENRTTWIYLGSPLILGDY